MGYQPMNTNPLAVLNNIQTLRKQGDLQQASQLLNPLLQTHINLPEVLAEAIRILVLDGQTDQALDLLSKGQSPEAPLPLEEGCLIRLALLTNKAELVPPAKPDMLTWVARFYQERQDAPMPAQPLAISLQSQSGALLTHVQIGCPSCRGPHTLLLPITWMVEKRSLCPTCFGIVSIDFDGLKSFIERKHPELLSKDLDHLDEQLFEIQEEVADWQNPDIPLICSYMNQQYLYLFLQTALGSGKLGAE